MKYFKLTNSTDINEIGYYPQDDGKIINIGSLGGINGDYSIGALGKIKQIEKLPELYLAPKAIETTYITSTAIPPWFLTIKNDFITFLNDFNIDSYQSWKIKVVHDKIVLTNYSLFHISIPSQDKYIDFEKSEFYLKELGNLNKINFPQLVSFNDYEEYVIEKDKLRKNEMILMHKRVTINLDKIKEDMFRLVNTPLGGYFVSEKLKNAIEEKGFTGMRFKEITEIDNRIEVIY